MAKPHLSLYNGKPNISTAGSKPVICSHQLTKMLFYFKLHLNNLLIVLFNTQHLLKQEYLMAYKKSIESHMKTGQSKLTKPSRRQNVISNSSHWSLTPPTDH